MSPDPLYKALETLRATDFADLPLSDLSTYLKDVFTSAGLIASSLPPVPGGNDEAGGNEGWEPQGPANIANSAKEILSTDARPPPPRDEATALRKNWGKPLKVSAKDNQLNVSVWKMAGHDRHGAWFARRSVHEGLGFEAWKRAMKREFATSRAIAGGPGAGAVRGIGADRLVVKEEVEGVGKMEVWHLSAQFPGPVTPREFLTMLLTTEKEFGQADGGGRTFMMVSIPVEHPDAPIKSGMVRGYYESVEMIREVPIIPSSSGDEKSKKGISTASNGAHGSADGDAGDGPEQNPVEWMMITRSDPGGGIPRFMVERSTPASITADTVKFLDWATKIKDEKEDEPDVKLQEEAEEHVTQKASEFARQPSSPDAVATATVKKSTAPGVPMTAPEENSSGILASIAGAVQSSIEAYTPNPVLEHLPTTLFASKQGQEDEANHYAGVEDDDDDSTSDTDSTDSFESAMPFRTAEEGDRPLSASSSSTENPLASKSDASLGLALENPSQASGLATPDSISSGKARQEEKELRKLIDRKKELDRRFAARVEKDARKRDEIAQKSTREAAKKRSRMEKEERKTADRYARDIAKIEERQRKEEKRLLSKKRKQEEKDQLAKLEKERDEALAKVEVLTHESRGLKEQVGELQRELTVLVRELGHLPGGSDVLKAVKGELATPRPESPNSERSKKSKVSFDSKRGSIASN